MLYRHLVRAQPAEPRLVSCAVPFVGLVLLIIIISIVLSIMLCQVLCNNDPLEGLRREKRTHWAGAQHGSDPPMNDF